MSVRIRDYASGDLESVVRLVGSVLAEYGFTPQTGGVEKDLAEAHMRYAGARAGVWVAVDDDGAIVGSVAVRPKEGSTCELKRLYVRMDKRGAGIGQTLYAHAEAFARAAGYERIWLDSSRRFALAHRLYERNGFALVASIDNDWEDNVYEKRLSPNA